MNITSLRTSGTSAAVIESIFEMHFPAAESVLDLTWGRGTFWHWDWFSSGFTLSVNDKYAELPPTDSMLVQATRWDSRSVVEDLGCPEWQRWDVVVFDPPFTANGPQKGTDRHQDRYGSTRDLNGAPQNIHDVWRLLDEGTRTACRLARLGVIIKTQDVIESGRYWDSETVACTAIAASNFRVEDKVRLLVGRRAQPDAARGAQVRHFRDRPSVFIVGKP